MAKDWAGGMTSDLYVTCRRCGGWGSIETSQSEDGRFSYQDQCPECSSHGVVPASPADILAAVRTLPGVVDISADDLLYEAWTVIANAGWDGADKSEGWQEAAVRWRDKWHAYQDSRPDKEEE